MGGADYDLIIVGGGLAGSSLAIALAPLGIRILIVEHQDQFRDRIRGEVLMPWGTLEAKRLGIYDLLLGSCAIEVPYYSRFKPAERLGIGKFFDIPSRQEIFDYTYDGVMRSLEFSLERLGLDSVEILFVHDVDIFTHGTAGARDAHVETLMSSGYKALVKLRDEKVIKAFGAGINESEVAETLTRRGDFDIFLLAGRYTLLEQKALDSFLPLCEERGIGIVLGGPYNSGILAIGAKPNATYNYTKAPKDIMERVRRIEAVCKRHNVKLPEAALRFPLAHPSVVSVIPGGVTPAQVKLNVKTLAAKIPKALWHDLKAEGLLDQRAPTPK